MALVLLIDDDRELTDRLSEALREHGVDTLVTGDGNEGLGFARERKPTAIVLCVELTKISGFSICNKLKKDAVLSDIPLVLTSARVTRETLEQHKKLKTRADEYISKPCELSDFLDCLGRYVELSSDSEVDALLDDLEIDFDDLEEQKHSAARSGGTGQASVAALDSLNFDSGDGLDVDFADSAPDDIAATVMVKLDELPARPQTVAIPNPEEFARSEFESSGDSTVVRQALKPSDRLNEIELGELKEENESLSRSVAAMKSEIESLRTQLDAVRQERDRMDEDLIELQRKRQKAKKALGIAIQLADDTRSSFS